MVALKKIYTTFFKLLEWFAMLSLVVMTCIVFMDVILRYIFRQGFSWTQEISELLLVWFSLIGMAIGVVERIHISIEMFTNKLPKKVLAALESFNHVLIAIYGGVMVFYGLQIMDKTKMSTMPATKLPSAVLYVILPLSGALILLNGLVIAGRKFKEMKTGGND